MPRRREPNARLLAKCASRPHPTTDECIVDPLYASCETPIDVFSRIASSGKPKDALGSVMDVDLATCEIRKMATFLVGQVGVLDAFTIAELRSGAYFCIELVVLKFFACRSKVPRLKTYARAIAMRKARFAELELAVLRATVFRDYKFASSLPEFE